MFVSLGSAAENIEAAVDYLREQRGAKVGSIHINVIRPFPDAAVVKALRRQEERHHPRAHRRADGGRQPDGARHPHRAEQGAAGRGRAPARSRADQMPRLFARRLRPRLARLPARAHDRRLRVRHRRTRARKDGKRAADGVSFIVLGVDHPYAVKSNDTPSLLPDKAIAVRFHSIGGWGTITTGKNLGAIIGDLNDLLYERDKVVDEFGNPKEIIHVSANPKYGSEKKGAPTSYFMIAAPERIRVNCDLRHVNVVLCCDPKAFTHTNPLDGMSEGGSLVWESEEEGETGVGAAAALGAQADHRQEHPRLHAARLQDRAQGDRSRRPAAAHAGQRVPRRVLRRVADAPGVRHHRRSSSATRCTSSTSRSSAGSATRS